MRVRWIGLALALALAGGAAGYAYGRARVEEPGSLARAEPLPAVSPSLPVNQYDVVPDPKIAPLQPDVPLRRAKFRAGGLRMTADVPKGWRRAVLSGHDTWNFAPADNPTNTYVLRVALVAGDRTSVNVARSARISALQDAETNGDLQHVVVEDTDDGDLTASYIDDRHQRVTVQRWLPRAGSTEAYATVAVTGRQVDRAGMTDLLERVAASADY